MQDRLVFLIGSPRSGTTLLSRMLGTHPEVVAPVEPHLMPPLAHLGFHEKVDAAPYDPVITQIGLREFVAKLPRGEEDYLEALRRCTDRLYERALEPSGARYFLDKTPAYSLVLDFLARLYPQAHYVVLTRHPLAVWSSFVDSFFDGDHEVAHAHQPLLERYVPAIARFVREKPVPLVHLRYEDLVSEPERELRRICDATGLTFDPGMIEYGASESGREKPTRGLGDPTAVAQESRPTEASVKKWAQTLAEPAKQDQAREILARLLDPDLETWGYPRADILADLEAVRPAGAARPRRMNRYALERRLVVALRRNIHTNALGRLVRRVRFYCDVLLR